MLTKHPDHDPLGIHTHHMTAMTHPSMRMAFDPTQYGVDRPVVSCNHLCPDLSLVSEGEQNRHRLWRREGGVIAPHRFLPEPATQVTSRRRILTSDHRKKRIRINLTGETKIGRAQTPPSARWLVALEVIAGQVIGVVATRLDALQRSHPHRHRAPPFTQPPQVCTRLSISSDGRI